MYPPNIFASTPKITAKPHFGETFNAKPIIETAICKSHVNGATKLKLYSYIGKYLRCYITEYFMLFRVVVERPKGFSVIFCDV